MSETKEGGDDGDCRGYAENDPRCDISKWGVLRGAVNTLIVIRCIRVRLPYTGCPLSRTCSKRFQSSPSWNDTALDSRSPVGNMTSSGRNDAHPQWLYPLVMPLENCGDSGNWRSQSNRRVQRNYARPCYLLELSGFLGNLLDVRCRSSDLRVTENIRVGNWKREVLEFVRWTLLAFFSNKALHLIILFKLACLKC